MKILFLSTWFPFPADNGSKIRVYHLLRALGTKHEVTLISFGFGAVPAQPDPLKSYCQQIKIVPMNPFVVNQTPAWRRFLSPSPVVTRPISPMHHLVQKTIQYTRFDAIIASTEVMATYALQASSTTAKVLEEHNSLTRWMGERYAAQNQPITKVQNWFSWQKTRWYEARLFRKFGAVVMVSELDGATCRQLPGYAGNVHILPNGIDCQTYPFAAFSSIPNTLVFNGSLTYAANYEAIAHFLQHIYPLIHQAIPHVTLTITGSTEGVNMESLVIDSTIQFTGHLPDIRPVVGQAAVCVIPILQGGGTRLKILEAMALGTPVISTSKGAEGLNLTHGKQLLLADDPYTFAQQTIALLRNSTLRQHLAIHARLKVEKEYNWQEIGQNFTELVENVAQMNRLG